MSGRVREIEIEDRQDGDDEIEEAIRYSISSYGADMPVDGIIARLKREEIFIPPFQRKFVWTHTQASKFIESLLLGLPVPGIFLFREPETRKLMVVDGQQRLRTLQYFEEGLLGKREFRLIGVSTEFSEKTYKKLTDQARIDFNDSILHATIFQQDEPSDDRSSIYSVFERLNTGGTALQPQEIRNCIYRGKLNDLLAELADIPHWQKLYGASRNRKKDEEIILRFLALYYSLETYERPMKRFLNNFMENYQHPDENRCDEFRRRFEDTVKVVADVITPKALRPGRALNVSVADAVLVGLAHRLENGPIRDHDGLKAAHDELLKDMRDEELYTSGTTDKERVNRRIELARTKYSAVG